MEKVRKKVFVFICMTLISVVSICTVLGIGSGMTLYGVVNEVPFPAYNHGDVWAGKYQAQIDEWYKNNFPLRSWYVRTNNQLLYSLGANVNDSIIVGKDGWLYTEEYTSSMLTELADFDQVRLKEYAAKVRQVKEKLETVGKQLVYVITPSKTEVYPENLPYRYAVLLQERERITNGYDFLKEQLTQQGVPYIDMTAILKEQISDVPFFSKTGIHWNYYAAALCAEQIVKSVDANVFTQINVKPMEEPYGTEQDAYLLSNIYNGKKDAVYYAVEIDYSNVTAIRNKKVLEMSTSFSGELERVFFPNDSCVWNQFTRYQYFASKTFSKGLMPTHMDGSYNSDAFKGEVADADIVIIENNNSYVPGSHYEFVDYILELSEEELSKDYCENLDIEEVNIDFSVGGNAEEYIRDGFYLAEEGGRWAMPKAEICIDLRTSQDLVLELECVRLFANTRVLFNDTIVWQTDHATEVVEPILISLDLVNNDGVNFITIITDEKIQSPVELRISEDPRKLAHWIHRVILRTDTKGGK